VQCSALLKCATDFRYRPDWDEFDIHRLHQRYVISPSSLPLLLRWYGFYLALARRVDAVLCSFPLALGFIDHTSAHLIIDSFSRDFVLCPAQNTSTKTEKIGITLILNYAGFAFI
jgi:hypothetical protein